MEQGTQEWLDARKGLITGSRVGAIIGVNPYSKPEDVMREMVRQHFGLPAEFHGNEATQFGHDHEPIALQDYEVFTGNDVERVGLITCPDMPYLAVSPDGLIGSSAGLEIKCPFSGVLSSIKDKPHYYAQVCLSLIVTIARFGTFGHGLARAASSKRSQKRKHCSGGQHIAILSTLFTLAM